MRRTLLGIALGSCVCACASQQPASSGGNTSPPPAPTQTYMPPVSPASPTPATTAQPAQATPATGASPAAPVTSNATPASAGPPSAEIGEPSVSGQVANAGALTSGMKNDFQRCYSKALESEANAAGTLLVALQLGKDGTVSRADVTPIGNVPASAQACIRSRAQSAKFSAPKEGTAIVSFSVSLTRGAAPAAASATSAGKPTQTGAAGTTNELKEVAVSPPGFEHADKVAQFVRAKARECYRDTLRTEPRAEGNVAIAVWLDAKGVVEKVEALRTGTLSDTVTTCIKKRSVPAKFQAPKIAPTVVTVPIRLALKPTK